MKIAIQFFVVVLTSFFSIKSFGSGFIAGQYNCKSKNSLLTVENLSDGRTRISNPSGEITEVSFGSDCKAPIDLDGNDYGVKYSCGHGQLQVTQAVLDGDGNLGTSIVNIFQAGNSVTFREQISIGGKTKIQSYTCIRNQQQ